MGRRHSEEWETLSDAEKAFIERQLAKTKPLAECDPARVRRLAVLLGLRPPVIETGDSLQ
ncbi:hypothetical protein AB3X52_04610 [Nocardioides sp. DS6]|uniref:Uncharacterized protein n=1 Tax=Nocardioides eburneus TaxID=3231482 RepID=A0ABV3SVC6_9ACTN